MAWVEQSNFRGTFDIIWISPVNIGMATQYSSIFLPQNTHLRMVGSRVSKLSGCITSPDFVLTNAAGQFSEAKWSIKAFNTATHTAGWNFDFPTIPERTPLRTASLL
jgi:hypothetical protein